MKINELIGLVRARLKQQSDDSKYSDLLIYTNLRLARASAIARKINRKESVSNFTWQTICLKLEKSLYQDCSCVDVGCHVLKSTTEIPSVVVAARKPLIKVETFGRISLPYVTPDKQRININTELLGDRPAYYIQNNKLIVWNTLDYRAIIVTGVFEDPTKLEDIKICNENGDEYNACSYDPKTDNFPLEDSMVNDIVDFVVDRLTRSIQIPDDNINNAQEEV